MLPHTPVWHGNCLPSRMENTDYKISGDMLTVCAWCYPAQSIYETYPSLRCLGLRLSHGICKACKAKTLEQIQTTKNP